ncbi:MAG: hypothetical protein OXR66_06375 [Candidatus Woesearchaeota archaeon]|nr:hypothetical protein [Candidatus Woesearchaeota archaeon]
MEQSELNDLITAVKAKKELANLDDTFVREKIEKLFAGNAKLRKKYDATKSFKQFSKSKEWEFILKAVRKELRVIYGVFQGDRTGVDVSAENLTAVLETHISTRERIPYFDMIYKELVDRIPAPRTLLDLGCGLNPLSYSYMKKHGWTPSIVGVDISAADMDFLSDAMLQLNIPGKTIAADLVKQADVLDAVDAEVTFVLKLLDTLEEAERHVSYKLFEHIHSKWIVVSFATKSLGGKKNISSAGRTWFERLLHRKELSWETFSVPNELFYVITNV